MTLETFRDGSWTCTGEKRLMSHANRFARVHQNLQVEDGTTCSIKKYQPNRRQVPIKVFQSPDYFSKRHPPVAYLKAA